MTIDNTCLRCNGRGSSRAFVHSGSASRFMPDLKCFLCDGAGSVSNQTMQWFILGRQHRIDRVARSESLMECAGRLGIKASELSNMESGRTDPSILCGGEDGTSS